MTLTPCRRQRGFTFLELSAALALTTGLIIALSYKTSDIAVQQANLRSTASLALADQHLREFAARMGRLPCPDSDNNGVEDCQASKGTLPYRTLGLAAMGYQQGEIPILYGVYRNATADADLAVLADRFNPTNADDTTYSFNNRNSLDFCIGLRNAAEQTSSTNYLYQQSPDFPPTSMAFMLATSGHRDADGKFGPYDGLNAKNGPGFQSSDTPLSVEYDDNTQGRGANELFNLMRCDVTLRSLDLAANAIALEEEVVAFATSNAETAAEGVKMNAVGTAIAAWGLAQAGAALISANTTLGISSGLLASATVGCAVPPFATCALVPVYTASVASATTGVALSATALGLAAGAVGAQIAATALYSNIAKKTGVPETTPGQGLKPDAANQAYDDYLSKKNEADIALADYQTAQSDFLTAAAETEKSQTSMENKLDQLTSGEAELRDQIYGNPRPADIDPENPPAKDDIILGAAPAIDAWRQAESSSQSFGDIDLVDENGDAIDLNASTDKAKTTAEDEQQKALDLADSHCSQTTSCNKAALRDALTAYLDAYSNDRRLSATADKKRTTADNKKAEEESAYIGYQAMTCAISNKDYDATTDSCTANAPGTAAQGQSRDALCNPLKPSYDPNACAALTSGQPATGTLVEFNRGAENIVTVLDAKGTLQ